MNAPRSTIDLKNFIGDLIAHPFATAGHNFSIIGHNIVDNRYKIIILCILIPIIRWLAFKSINAWVKTRIVDNDYMVRVNRATNISQARALRHRKRRRRAAVASLFKSSIGTVMGIISVIMLLAQCGIIVDSDTVKWAASGLTLAFAFGLQVLIRDFMSGVHAVSEGQYGLGDYIDLGFGFEGEVEHIGVRTVRLGGPDGTVFHINHSVMTKLGNKTQSESHLLMDVTLSWADDEKKTVTESDLTFAEKTLADSIKTVRTQLNAANALAFEPLNNTGKDISLPQVASVVPSITEDLSDTTLTNLEIIAQGEHKTDAEAKAQITKALSSIESMPLLKSINIIGIVRSAAGSLTIRLSVDLPASSAREQALAAIRRQVFVDFSQHNMTTDFEEINEGVIL